MAHPESKMRASVLAALRKNGFHAEAVDNEACSPGTPDVTYCGRDLSMEALEGWLELKQVPYPLRDDTIVRVPHLTTKQRYWIRKRWAAGGNVGILMKIHNEKTCMWALIAGRDIDVIGAIPAPKYWRASQDAICRPDLSSEWLHGALSALHSLRKQEISSD